MLQPAFDESEQPGRGSRGIEMQQMWFDSRDHKRQGKDTALLNLPNQQGG